MIDSIRNEISSEIGRNVIVKINVGRNKWELYEGILYNAYPSVFTVKVKDSLKSFMYADVLINDVIIKYN